MKMTLTTRLIMTLFWNALSVQTSLNLNSKPKQMKNGDFFFVHFVQFLDVFYTHFLAFQTKIEQQNRVRGLAKKKLTPSEHRNFPFHFISTPLHSEISYWIFAII